MQMFFGRVPSVPPPHDAKLPNILCSHHFHWDLLTVSTPASLRLGAAGFSPRFRVNSWQGHMLASHDGATPGDMGWRARLGDFPLLVLNTGSSRAEH